MTTLSPEQISSLEEARQAYIALDGRKGPHVTPELFAWSGGRFWFASAASTVKARTLEDGDDVAVLARTAGRDVLLRGPVERFDLLCPQDLARRSPRLVSALRATAGFTVRNASDLLAFGRDSVVGPLGWPERRILFAVSATDAALVENDALVESNDDQTAAPPDHAAGYGAPSGGERAVVAVPGPAALPARWQADGQQAFVAGDLLDRYEVGPHTPVAVVVDHYGAPGPAAKAGLLLRGTATRHDSVLEVDVDHEAEWSTDWSPVPPHPDTAA